MNTNRKKNAAFLLLAPLMLAAVLSASQAHADTITIAGFAPKQMSKVLLKTEEIIFYHKIGSIKATCGGSVMRVSQVLPLYKVNALLAQQCPNRGLSVTFTSHRPTPAQIKALDGAAILKHP